MKQRAFDPLRLDVAAFAADASALEGARAVSEFHRLSESVLAPLPDAPMEPVRWGAQGETRPRRGGAPELWLHLQADTVVQLQCQRCLQAMTVPLAVERSFRFVRDEAEAEAEDPDSDEDVLALSRTLDLFALVEDELILELPLVPRHDVCPQPLPVPQDEPLEEDEPRPNPFAKLAALKRGPSSH